MMPRPETPPLDQVREASVVAVHRLNVGVVSWDLQGFRAARVDGVYEH